jgi:signal transduction histidine kinase
MKRASLEPGLLSVFRLFTGLRLVLMVLGLVPFLLITQLPEQPNLTLRWFNIADAAFLMAYLSWPALGRIMGRAFLPIGILLATVGPIAEQNLALREWTAGGFSIQAVGILQAFLFLFVPLVLTAWQYNFRSVVLFSLGTALLDWILAVSLIGDLGIRILPLAAIIYTRTTAFFLVGYMVARLMGTQRQQRRELGEANTQLAHYAATLEQLATSRERNRLARELHDTLAHSLSGVAVQLEAVKTLWGESAEDARGMLEQSLATTRNGLTETRRALQALRASPLEDLGLALALRNLAESITSRTGLNLDLEMPERLDLDSLSPGVEQGIYRVAQEALENVAQHAQARHVRLSVAQENGHFAMTITDDGRGFDPENVDLVDQFGLQGMRERTELLGGDLRVESKPGSGTTIRLAWGEVT